MFWSNICCLLCLFGFDHLGQATAFAGLLWLTFLFQTLAVLLAPQLERAIASVNASCNPVT